MNDKMNRETWLNALAEKMAPRFAELGFPLPRFRVTVGFTSKGQTMRVGGQCWDARVSADKTFEVIISIGIDDTTTVAAILAHELTHAAVGLKEGHRGNFAKVMAALGMKRPFTQSIPGEECKAWIAQLVEELGPIPHARLNFDGRIVVAKEPGEGGNDEGEDGQGDDDVPNSSGPKKQGTRLRKACCGECGYTVRVTAKWLEVGPPHCPEHGAMSVDD